MIDLSRAEWRKAAASTGSNGGCVHVIPKNIFAAFLDDLKNGQYDL